MNGDHTGCKGRCHKSCCQESFHLCSFHDSHLLSDQIILVREQGSSRLLAVLIEEHCPKMAHPREQNSGLGILTRHSIFPSALCGPEVPDHRQFCAIPEGPGPSALRRGTELFWPIINYLEKTSWYCSLTAVSGHIGARGAASGPTASRPRPCEPAVVDHTL
jgi:hypothetical protein